MARPATIDKDPRKREIVAAIVRGESDRAVSERFEGVSEPAVLRYRRKLAAEAKAKAKQARELARKHAKKADVLFAGPAALEQAVNKAVLQEGAAGMLRTVDAIASELEEERGFLKKLRRACDAWLSDPDNPSEYSLAPRTTEMAIHIGISGRPEKLTMAELLIRAERASEKVADGRPVSLVENGTKVADTRKLIRETADSTRALLETLAKVTGILRPDPAATVNVLVLPEWVAMRGRILAVLERHPDALREVLAELEGA